MTIDLHGLDSSTATGKILMAIFYFEENPYDDVEIITGNGGVLNILTESILEENNIS